MHSAGACKAALDESSASGAGADAGVVVSDGEHDIGAGGSSDGRYRCPTAKEAAQIEPSKEIL